MLGIGPGHRCKQEKRAGEKGRDRERTTKDGKPGHLVGKLGLGEKVSNHPEV